MKTRIIYISGGDVFAPSDVKAAFENVRDMLGLSADTVIFGVPVDSDDIGAGLADSGIEIKTVAAKKKTVKVKSVANPAEPDKTEDAAPAVDVSESPAPILSVLGIVRPEVADSAPDAGPLAEYPTAPAEPVEPVVAAREIITEITESVSVDIELRSAPITNKIQTIEDIFAGLAPLAEEKPADLSAYEDAAPASNVPDAPTVGVVPDLESDATLSKMAEEFISSAGDSADEKPARASKVGKLKNILPFKKAKKEDTSMFGDLFGWAGIAANDDDEKFSMPDFFRANN